MDVLEIKDIFDKTQKPGSHLSFFEKAEAFSYDYLRCCIYLASSKAQKYAFTKKLFSTLATTSQLLEDFLDFHGGKNNRTWYFYRELSAAVRHLSLGGYSQNHILNRLNFYDLPDTNEFRELGNVTLEFVTSSLRKIAPVIIEEAKRLGITIPEKSFSPDNFFGVTTNHRLEYDIDDVNRDQQKKNIVKIASEFLSIATNFDQLGFYEPYDFEKILQIVPDKVNEVEVRRFEMLVHNLQSSFDTYVIHGGYHFGERKLKQLRGYFSCVFHLLQIMGRLLHFYERHLYEAGYKNIYKQVQDRLSELVDPKVLLDCTINFGLYYVCHYLNIGKKLAREILNENIERSVIRASVPYKRGFHLRPSLLVAKIVQNYGGKVELCVAGDRFDASSVLDIQWAGGKIAKENIQEVFFEGDVRALQDIEILASVNYGEDTMGKDIPLPRELKYLRS
jgi:phosphotransferase system HPr-like phosphotransfer protein